MQETRLRNHGSGNDGPIHVTQGQKVFLNQDRYSTSAPKGSYTLALHQGQGDFEPGEFVIVHQVRTRMPHVYTRGIQDRYIMGEGVMAYDVVLPCST
eukprot:COSAG05_NODE_1648_length_4340_cov_79.370667_4_plen_97_part_00